MNDILHLSDQLELMRQTEPQIKRVRREIFQLARNAPSLEVMHWYMWLDECFENDEFHLEDFSTVQWRSMALSNLEGYKVNFLLSLITPVLRAYGCVDGDGRELPPAPRQALEAPGEAP